MVIRRHAGREVRELPRHPVTADLAQGAVSPRVSAALAAEERDAGRVVCLVGVAPVKPAEFVVFKLSQSAGGADVETVGG
jgi:hypothetical protein